MNPNSAEKIKTPRPRLRLALGLCIGVLALGIALALGFSFLLLDACQGEQSCQKPLLALFGGLGFVQAVSLVAIFALVDYLNRKSERRLLSALRQ